MIPQEAKFSKKNWKVLPGRFNIPSRKASWRISKDLSSSFVYAGQGLLYGFSSQRNFRIQACLGCLTFCLGLWLDFDPIRLTILIFTIAAVLVLELINTAIEAVVDLAIGRRFHHLARIAKDCSAGAVLVASISSFLIALLLFWQPFLNRLGVS